MKIWNLFGSLWYLFLFLLPLQTVYLLREPFVGGVKWEYGIVAIYGTDILLLLVFAFLLFRTIKGRIKNQEFGIKSSPLTDSLGMMSGTLMILVAWVGVSIFWAPDQILALYFFVKLLLAVGLFFVVRLIEIDMKKVVFVLLATGVLQSGVGIAQFLSQHSISSLILGMSAHDASVAGSSVLKIDSGRFLRAYGTFPHPNILGGFLGVILVMSISYFVFRIKYEKSWKCVAEITVMLSGSLLIFLGLILTFSRVAWLGVFMGLVVMGLSVFKQKDCWIRRRFLKILLALGMASLVFGFILHEEIFPRFDTKAIEREGSVSERVVSLQDARTLLNRHPFIGVGAGNFTAGIIEKGEKGLMGEKGEMGSRPVWSIQPAHDVFVLIWSELGVVGLILFPLFLFLLAKCVIPLLDLGIQRALWNLDSRLLGNDKEKSCILKKGDAVFGIAVIALLPSLLLDHWLWSSHFGILFFFLLLGFASRKSLTE